MGYLTVTKERVYYLSQTMSAGAKSLKREEAENYEMCYYSFYFAGFIGGLCGKPRGRF
jgi:hypothetical protein